MKSISLIVALDKNFAIGKNRKIPWNLPADLQYFKTITMGHPIIMGRKTHESIGRALPGRKNIVISSQSDYLPFDGTFKASSLEEALALAGEEEIFIIGGAQVYAQAFSSANRLYLTFIPAVFFGDVFFPEFDMHEWKSLSCQKRMADAQNPYHIEWIVLERI